MPPGERSELLPAAASFSRAVAAAPHQRQAPIDQPVLAGDFRGGVSGDPAAQRLGLHQHIGDDGAVQEIRAQNPRRAAADNQDAGAQIPLQGRKARPPPGLLPQ